MDFEYINRRGSVTITDIKRTVDSISIPKLIDGKPIDNIELFAFIGCDILKYINGVKLTDGVNVINNRFILYRLCTYKIRYQIGDDYICGKVIFFIDSKYIRI